MYIDHMRTNIPIYHIRKKNYFCFVEHSSAESMRGRFPFRLIVRLAGDKWPANEKEPRFLWFHTLQPQEGGEFLTPRICDSYSCSKTFWVNTQKEWRTFKYLAIIVYLSLLSVKKLCITNNLGITPITSYIFILQLFLDGNDAYVWIYDPTPWWAYRQTNRLYLSNNVD